MSIKTGNEIRTDIFNFLKDSSLSAAVNGSVYYEGIRPRDSQKEDIIVIYTTGFTDQIQEGVVTINIYVPDIQFGASNVFVENIARTNAIQRAAQNWVNALTTARSSYLFKLRAAITTGNEDSIRQHFIHIRLGYRLFNG